MTKKTFIYHVADKNFTDTEAFGDVWREARKYATELQTYITRTIIDLKKGEMYEYYHRMGMFIPYLNKEDFDEHAKIFG